MRAQTPQFLTCWARRAVFGVLERVTESTQIRITSALKGMLWGGRNARSPLAAVRYWLTCVQELQDHIDGEELARLRDRGSVCLTHDVDWVACQCFASEIAAVEEDCGVRSSFNFLTEWNYVLDAHLVTELNRRGFEIGLHGTRHDIAIGCRAEATISASLSRGREALPVAVSGYRSPALSSSPSLFRALEAQAFTYDSSLLTATLAGRGTGMCFPYRYPGHTIWEIPLTLQDSTLFRDLQLGDDDGLEMAVQVLRAVTGIGGVFVFNGHPGILQQHMRFYRGLLREAVKREVATPSDVVSSWKHRAGGLQLKIASDETYER